MPPHTGLAVGSRDDSLQNCLALAPKQPKKVTVMILMMMMMMMTLMMMIMMIIILLMMIVWRTCARCWITRARC